MLFRVIDNKLYQVKVYVGNEDEFIEKNKTLKFVKVNPQDLPTTDIETDEIFYELDADGKIIVDVERTQARADEYFQNQKDKIYNNIQELCDTKTQQLLNYLAGHEVSQYQLERYKQKEAIAKAYLNDGSYEDELKIEANLVGMTVSDFANLILQTAKEFNDKSNYFISLIEAFRVKVQALIKNATTLDDLTNIQKLIDEAAKLGADSTPQDIENLFADVNATNNDTNTTA